MSPVLILTAALAAPPVDFDTAVVPVLTKAGCNAGACHGAAAGRGGFALSLYGSDPARDHATIAHALEGRRVNLARPEASLVLLKPTNYLPHGGGTRLDPDEEGVQRVLAWIAQGAERTGTRRLERFDVSPSKQVVDATGTTIPLSATATYDDGTTEDVTRFTVFTPEDPAAVAIDEEAATATLLRRGRHVVIARFLDRVVPLRLLVPLTDAPVDLAAEPVANFVDRHVYDTLDTLRIPVSPTVDDATFLRRVRLDLTGRLPTPDEVRTFLADESSDKRERLVDRLLESDDFTDFWTYRLAGLLRIRSLAGGETIGPRLFHDWVRERVAAGTPWDEVTRTLLTAAGDSHDVAPANFYRMAAGAREQTEFASELFLGVRLRCANCHDHPLDRWTQDDYHGLAAVFAKLETGRVVASKPTGEVLHPATGEPALPRLPGERFLDDPGDNRTELAAWVTDPANPFFARAMTNRLWRWTMGRGLVEPADDFRATNPPTHPELLDALAADFVAHGHGHDLRRTLQVICTSATYARSAVGVEGNRADDRFYSHFLESPLPPEVLADAIADVTGVFEPYGDEPPGTRAVTLFDPKIPSRSLEVLGRCDREESCESDGTMAGLATTLHVVNGPLVNAKLVDKSGRLSSLLAKRTEPSALVQEFYLRALSREPTAEERAFWQEEFSTARGEDEIARLAEDFVWSLLRSREFRTNH